jgi:hypothetical protein
MIAEDRQKSEERLDEPPGPEPDAGSDVALRERKAPGGVPWESDHPVNLRLSIPLPFGRYYLTIVGGKERRSAERLVQEKLKHPVVRKGNIIFLAVLGTMLGLAVFAAIEVVAVHLLEQGRFLIGRS